MAFFDVKKLNLRAMGFCGVADNCSPEQLQLLSAHDAWIGQGILFRPDLEGTPRYASKAWVDKLCHVNKTAHEHMRLAGHLCQSRCQEVLEGDATFVTELQTMGFSRVQINATAANGVLVDKAKTAFYVQNMRNVMEAVPSLQFIIQDNDETKSLWSKLVESEVPPVKNMSLLFDASCGKGILATSFPAPMEKIPCGYAGGMGPGNIASVLDSVRAAADGQPVWIDMESSLRTIIIGQGGNREDTFSIDKCFKCILAGINVGLPVAKLSVLSI